MSWPVIHGNILKRDDQSQTYSNPLENYESVFISESAALKNII